jgi:hypothetical protein
MQRTRREIIRMIEGMTEEQADRIPHGFNNNVRWQLGHIYIYGERMFQLTNQPTHLPEGYPELFSNGTKPAEWTLASPFVPLLMRQLEEQLTRTTTLFAGRLHETMERKVLNVENPTIAEALLIFLMHEKEHAVKLGIIKKLTEVV